METLGDCPMVCTIATTGLAPDVARDKAFLAARLAMTAIALLWERPSRALAGFGLSVDGTPRPRRYLVLRGSGGMTLTSGIGKPLGSTWVDAAKWPSIWGGGGWLTGPTAELLTALCDPARPAKRGKVALTLLHALWWLHEACQAEAPLMAAAKFGACIDVLAGGRSEGRILQLIKALFGAGPDDPITPDGRSARSVVRLIYGAARSQTMHGSNDRHDHDWRGVRDLAEDLARKCFVHVLGWLEDHRDANDLADILKTS